MNVVVEHQPNCLATLQIEVPVEQVAQEWEKVVKEFQKYASIQGYRKGFAPKKLIEVRFAKEIREELERKLLESSLKEAIKREKIEMVSSLGFENVELAKDRPLHFSAKIEVAPTFDLPPYHQIELDIAPPEVTEKDVRDVLENARKSRATYQPIEGRSLEMGDYAVISYTTQVDGVPLKEFAPDAPGVLFDRKNTWFRLDPGSQMPLEGFTEALVGMNPGETKNFEISVKPDFLIENLRGKNVAFGVLLEAIQKEVLPELSDELAHTILPGKTLEELKSDILERLKHNVQLTFANQKREALVAHLLSKVRAQGEVQLPSQLVLSEQRRIFQDLYQKAAQQGVKPEELNVHAEKFVAFAYEKAQEKLLGTFLLLKIAEKENIRVTTEELYSRLNEMANEYKMPLAKMIKQLEERNMFGVVNEEILINKVLDFLEQQAVLRNPAAAALSASDPVASPLGPTPENPTTDQMPSNN